MSALQNVPGTWLGIPDFGLTELISSASGKTTNPTYNNPAVYAQTGGIPQAQNTSTIPWIQPGATNTYTAPQQQTSSPPPSSNNDVRSNGGSMPNVGDISADGNYRWNGKGWEQRYPSDGGYSSYADFEAKQNAFREQQTGMINSQFGEYFSNLDRQIGLLPEEQATQEAKVGNLATGSQADITLGQQQTGQTIDTGIANAQQNKSTSLRDLEGDMRSSLFAGNQYLGARGAGDSSAADMYKFAISKQANKAKSGVLQTFNKTLGELDQKKVDLQNITNSEMTKLKTWKDNALLDVTKYINDKKDALQNLISQGRIDQATALRELNTTIYNQAQSRLQAIEQQATAFSQSMQQWATQRAASLDDYKLQLTKSAQFSVPDVIQSEMMAYAPQGQGSTSGGVQQFGAVGKKYDQYGRLI